MDNDSLCERVAKIDDRLNDIQIAISEIRSIYESQIRRLDRLENEIFGNGRPGLATQLRAVLWIGSGCLGFLALLAAQALAAWIR